MVVIIGIDVREDTHTAAAIDGLGTQIGRARTVPASSAGHLDLIRWAVQLTTTCEHPWLLAWLRWRPPMTGRHCPPRR